MRHESGRELDAEIAEKVMGFPPIATRYTLGGVDFVDKAVRHYSADIAAAWLVVDHLRLRGFELRYGDDLWVCRFGSAKAEAASAPLAICLAALQAIELSA